MGPEDRGPWPAVSSPATWPLLGHLERQSILAIYSSPPLDASGVIPDSPGHCGEPGPRAEMLPPALLDLGSVGSVLHRLQTAFQEALDLYHMVSQGAQGRMEQWRGFAATTWMSSNKLAVRYSWSPAATWVLSRSRRRLSWPPPLTGSTTSWKPATAWLQLTWPHPRHCLAQVLRPHLLFVPWAAQTCRPYWNTTRSCWCRQ